MHLIKDFMKRNTYLSILTGAVMLLGAACTSKHVFSPAFAVKADKDSYSAGDSTIFSFTGNPYNLSFYSGEPGHEYRFRNRTSAPGVSQLQFQSYRQNYNVGDTLQLLASVNFSARYDSTNIYNATWTDLTSRPVLSTGTNNTPSGIVDLTDLIKDSQYVYLAFRYVGGKHTGAQTTWTIASMGLNYVLQDGTNTFQIDTITNASWTVVNMKNTAIKWVVSTSSLKVTGSSAANAAPVETWVISKWLILNRVIPDVGVSLKNITNNHPTSYLYVYNNPGTYTATFVGASTTVYDSQTDVKAVQVQVNP
jgi:hypothetical protein